MKTCSGILFALLALPLFLAGPRLRADQLSELNGVTVKNVKIPFRDKGELQAMIFADEAEYRAKLLYGRIVVLNRLQKNVDPDRISNDWKLQPYPLRAPLAEVAKFWAPPRLNYCDAVICTPEAALDQLERSAAGDKLVQVRSPSLDLDGVGFAADFKRRQIKVNSDVRVIMRMPPSDPRKFGAKLPGKYEFLEGRSEMLHMDTARDRIMLLGKVEVVGEKFKLTCDRLTVQLHSDRKKRNNSSIDSRISAIYADGNVKMIRRLPPGAPVQERREVYGDHMICDMVKGQVTVTGDRIRPGIISGDNLKLRGRELVYFPAKRQLIVPRDCWMSSEEKGVRRYLRSDYGNFDLTAGRCDFLENVRGSAPGREISCDKMRVILRRKEGAPPARGEKTAAGRRSQSDGISFSDFGDFDMGSSEFERVLCRGRVIMARTDGQNISTLKSERAELDCITDNAVFSGNVRALADSNTLETETLVLKLRKSPGNPRNLELESARTLAPVRIAGTVDRETKEASSLTADRGFFDYAQNRVDFLGNVKAGRGKTKLTSDKLELFLAPGNRDDRPVAVPGLLEGSGKTLKNAVATGNAVMSDDRHSLQSDKLNFTFVPAPRGAPLEPGIFQSGSLRLTRVTGDGHVLVRSRRTREPEITPGNAGEKKAEKTPAAGSLPGGGQLRELRSDRMVSDMVRHRSVFSGQVIMNDEQNRLDCEELTLYGKTAAAAAGNAASKTAAPAEDVDADPFELPVENKVPSSIVVGNGVELDRAVAREKVVLRQPKGSEETDRKFRCDRAEFKSSDMTIVCTGTEEERPTLETEFKVHEADKFILHLKDERLETIGDVITR